MAVLHLAGLCDVYFLLYMCLWLHIHSFIQYFLHAVIYPETVQTLDVGVNKIEKNPCLCEVYIVVRSKRQ